MECIKKQNKYQHIVSLSDEDSDMESGNPSKQYNQFNQQ